YAVKKLSQLNNLIHLTIQIPTLDLGVELVQSVFSLTKLKSLSPYKDGVPFNPLRDIESDCYHYA
ncbi:unnamed protein product, partial [Didymodactylos carnosus]